MSRFFSHLESGVFPLILLVTFTTGFLAYFVWIYWPTRRARWEELGKIPLEDTKSDDA